jgi:hypothetical protein
MTPFGLFEPTAFAFTAGMALLWAAAIALRMRRDERSLRWPFLASFAAAVGLAELCALATTGDSSTLLGLPQLALSAAGLLALVEFGRRELAGRYDTLKKPWIYVLLAVAAAIKFALAGLAGLEAVCASVFAPLAGFLAALALAQRARLRSGGRWGLPLVAAAIAFFAIGYALSIAALQAFSALGLLAGVWRERREESPFPQSSSVFVRWRAPGAFMALTLLGCTALTLRGQTNDEASLVVQAGSTADDVATSAGVIEDIEIDSRQLARERANAQRYKQGLSILIAIAVVAAIWVGLSRLQRRM